MVIESRRKYYWLVTADPDTKKPYLVFGGNTEEEARQKGLEILGGIDFEIRGLPTRDMARASSMVKGRRLEDTHSLGRASERLGHNRSLNKLMRRRMLRVD